MRNPAVGIALAGCVALGACGVGGEAGPTKAQWTERADKICADAQAKVAALGPPPIGEPAKLPEWASKGVQIRSEQIGDLADLEEPRETKDDIDATLAEAKALLEEAKAKLEQGASPALISSLTDLQVRQQAIQKEIAAYGPARCGPE